MKHALLIYKANKEYKNIGDYIQSVAASQFTGKDVIFIDREQLNKYSGEEVKLIINGWFMHKPQNWPPSDKINPLIISFHINPGKAEKMLSEEGIAYLKKHSPIGCRDKNTEKLLLSYGIPAYFSGCLTLTLGMTYKHTPKSENVYFVDPYFETSKKFSSIVSYLLVFLFNFKTILTICKKKYMNLSLKSLGKSVSFYKVYSKVFDPELLKESTYINHMILEKDLGGEREKFKLSEQLLQKYSEAKLVVTSRIHAALPCLGMDTPVIFVTNDYFNSPRVPSKQGRFDGLIEHLNVLEYSNESLKPILGFQLREKIKIDTRISNKRSHLKLVERLVEKCNSFINSEDR